MEYIPAVFKAVSVTFSGLAMWIGANGVFRPTSFAAGFGIPIDNTGKAPRGGDRTQHQSATSEPTTRAYVRLMGIRELATGVILALFARQGKWDEMATILVTIGVLVAGTDGLFLARVAGRTDLGVFHALPGGMIALLSGLFLWQRT
ncbi:uncharacterized protein B0I36DRAFT_240893 [Microdochium trichocladiopsis]|uniref:DUF4267 domain-containing protein n=1 Tax=Microdochium trichocladiopsis TaxID=1682393 RepID=A0A9P9BVX1_9PEZI|nr:uncharacterized protein B0I36DRAFT_240893 [Microdochium trichocladiopsis]KAH7033747.1 hypothetical protein B0I36DRAFT_240893 [Microdochium trichocladiopsis]